ncbi:MAG TPA: hypothetical protein DHV22_13040 [Xanthomarina gelatinilytica]|uniref:Tape measure protein N-terminal domain-containing protein n=1 Tax=Xanthomarina gelatinilytica TaxID=1137281 RepID=A0A3D6BW72_9FLAO|nr:hypothetical protein [Xanthomarina gelatinilytica]
MATKKVNIDIVAKDRSQQALAKVRGSLDKVKQSVFNVKNALVGLGGGLVIKNLVNTGKEIENLQVRLKFLFGSTEEGAKAFDEMAKFASKVPFSLEEIQQGAGVLSVVAKDADELAHIMQITGNVAAVTGLDFRTASEQIQRSLSAGIGAADLFREKGVNAMLGFKAGAKVTIEETAEAFERVFGKGGQFDGATDELANTFEGTLSMIGDKFFNFKRTILDAGFFPELKKQFKDLDTFLADNSQTLDEIAIALGEGLAQAVRLGADAILFLKDNFDFLIESIKLLISFKVAGVFVALAGGILKANSAMLLFNATIKRNLFIAGAAIVISQFDKILDMLGRMPSDFDTASQAIAHNNEQIKHYENQLGQIQGTINAFLEQNKHLTKEQLAQNETYQGYIEILEETKQKLKEFAELNDELFKDAYPVYEDQIIKIAKALNKKEEAFNVDQIVEDLKKEQEALKAEELALKKVMQVYAEYGMQRRRMLKGIAEEEAETLETIQRQHEQYANTRILSDKQQYQKQIEAYKQYADSRIAGEKLLDHKKRLIEAQGKAHTIKEARSTLEEVAKVNKTAFMAFKAVRIAEATINAIKGASNALQAYTPPYSFIIAGLSLAKGLALVSQIKSTSFRQGGGSVNKNQPYMVGEAGPEMFVPSGSGRIVTNNQISNPQPVTVNFNINTVDAKGFNELLVNSRGVIVNMINSAVNEKGRTAIV